MTNRGVIRAMTVEVRRATLGDVNALVPLFEAYRSFYEQEPNPDLVRGFITDRLKRDESTVIVAEDSAQSLLGFAQLFPMFSSVSLGRAFVLNDLFVAPDSRRRGIGKALLRSAVELCRDQGAVRVSLSTAVSNESAQALYQATGWVRQTEFFVYTLKP